MRKLTPEQFKSFIDKKEINEIILSSMYWDTKQYTDNTLFFGLNFDSMNIVLPRNTETISKELNIGMPYIELRNNIGGYVQIYRIKEIKYNKTTFEYEIVIICEKVQHNKDKEYRLLLSCTT